MEVTNDSKDATDPSATKKITGRPAPRLNDDTRRAITDKNNTREALKNTTSDMALLDDYKQKNRC